MPLHARIFFWTLAFVLMNKNASIALAIGLIVALITVAIIWLSGSPSPTKDTQSLDISNTNSDPLPTPAPLTSEAPLATPSVEVSETATPPPAPQPPKLNDSDGPFLEDIAQLQYGGEIVSLLSNEELIRKLVRAVYGLSEGRVVRQYRPITSPKGSFVAQKIGQQTADTEQELYRVDRENYARYANYISLFSAVNDDKLVALYRFYLPTLEQAYQELGLGDGNFHETFIKAIDVLLTTPVSQDAHLLVQPTVFYKFADPQTEKLLPAQKLMIRIGQENREALTLELQDLKESLLKIQKS